MFLIFCKVCKCSVVLFLWILDDRESSMDDLLGCRIFISLKGFCHFVYDLWPHKFLGKLKLSVYNNAGLTVLVDMGKFTVLMTWFITDFDLSGGSNVCSVCFFLILKSVVIKVQFYGRH